VPRFQWSLCELLVDRFVHLLHFDQEKVKGLKSLTLPPFCPSIEIFTRHGPGTATSQGLGSSSLASCCLVVP
jgi:hypothetical protein